MTVQTVEQYQQFPDMEKRIRQFVEMRDKIKALKKKHEEELQPFNSAKDELEGVILGWLQALNSKNIRTDAGTAYVSTRISATVADGEVFWNYVKDNELFDLIDKRANAPAVSEHVDQHGVPPPGINYSTMLTLGVRRS